MIGYCTKVTFSLNKKRWVFPKDRFVEYEQRDEVWARVLGYGHEEGYNQTIELPCVLRSITTPEPKNNLIKTNILLTYVGDPQEILFKEQS